MRVYLCWPAGELKCEPPFDCFEIKDAEGRPWSCTPMRLDRGRSFGDDYGIDLGRIAVEGGADVVIVNAADPEELREMLVHGIRFVGFPLPAEEMPSEAALCPLPSAN